MTALLDVDQLRTFIAGARSPLGVKGDIPVPLAHFRFTPESRHRLFMMGWTPRRRHRCAKVEVLSTT